VSGPALCRNKSPAGKPGFVRELAKDRWYVGFSFPVKTDDVLQLDEIVFDDVPIIRLNDRPGDPSSILRPVESLSPGQRCSAILPILLLTGASPLIIDRQVGQSGRL
jgi:hypothetical protein